MKELKAVCLESMARGRRIGRWADRIARQSPMFNAVTYCLEDRFKGNGPSDPEKYGR